jgi:predicted transport protein
MPVFITQNSKLKKLSSQSFDKEKDLQTLVEHNLDELLGMYFLATEYTTTFGGRIDTLAVDYNGAPVIIEYKRNKNDNVINQGLSYLKWLQAQKVEFFEMLIIKNLGAEVARKIPIDWKNPRVVCIAEAYSKFDIDTVEVIPMRIELFKYRNYENGIFSLEPLGVSEQKFKSTSGDIPIVKPTIDSRIEGLTKKASPGIMKIFEDIRAKIFELDENITEKATTLYLAYRVTKNFAEIHVGKNHLKVYLRPIEYNDPDGKVEKVPDSYNWTLNRRIYLKSVDDVPYVMKIIEESYKDVL